MLKKIYDFLFYSCRHKWKKIGQQKVVYIGSKETATKYHLQCEKSGNIKSKVI